MIQLMVSSFSFTKKPSLLYISCSIEICPSFLLAFCFNWLYNFLVKVLVEHHISTLLFISIPHSFKVWYLSISYLCHIHFILCSVQFHKHIFNLNILVTHLLKFVENSERIIYGFGI